MQTVQQQPEFPLDHPDPLLLPEIELDLPHRDLGRITAILRSAERFTPVQQVLLPNRRTRTAYSLRDAQNRTLLVTTTTTDRCHSDFEEILLDQNGRLSWLKHNEAIAATERIEREEPNGLRDEIRSSWAAGFLYRDSSVVADGKGLRPPQLGALHAILSHWTLSTEPVTVVMPTGTGKTETMISLLITAQPKCLLVVVPSKALRNQTAEKFKTLGILPTDGLLKEGARCPLIGILEHQVKSEEDLILFDRCNVVVAVIDSIAKGQATEYLPQIADRCSHLVLDEAHHVAATSWSELKKAFEGKPIVQFTATPFREDRSPLGGKQIYNYPLHRAQAEGYFKPIHFQGIFEVETAAADRSIARKAVEQLRQDLAKGLEHRLMARCRTKKRADAVLQIYSQLAPDLNPIAVHSEETDIPAKIAALREGIHKIVVTVNMLAEGFDMPQLKVAAIHDIFKSLAITLQFAGRFPRVGGPNLGEPTIVTNTGFVEISNSLQSLYDEDPDWNELLAKFSFERIEQENRFNEFLRNAQDLGENFFSEDSVAARLTPQSLMPRYNAVAFRAANFAPHGISDGLEPGHRFVRGWRLNDPNMAFFVTRLVDQPRWTKSKEVTDSIWNLTALYFDAGNNLLYIGSSSSSPTNHQKLADAVTQNRAIRFQNEHPFRVFHGIQRLILQQVGLLNTGSRNLRYSMFTGSDVGEAISRVLTGRSTKSNIFGSGFRGGGPIEFGCSRKGKIWGREFGSLRGWAEWCDELGPRLLDDSINTENIIGNVLVPRNQETLPDKQPWFIDWPAKILSKPESTFGFIINGDEVPFREWDLELMDYHTLENRVRFRVRHESNADFVSEFDLKIDPTIPPGHRIEMTGGLPMQIKVSRTLQNLASYFQEYVPTITFIDQSTLEGCQLVEPNDDFGDFPIESLQRIDWVQNGVNIRRESFWKNGQLHQDSIQAHAIRLCQQDGFQLVFDDDGANEIADIVAIKDAGERIIFRLVHCKYSTNDNPGTRIDDIIEVSSQAVKTCRWLHDIKRLAKRMFQRNRDRTQLGQPRFIAGNPALLQKFIRIIELSSHIEHEVIVVQPGLSAAAASRQILSVLGSTDSYLRMAAGCPLQVWCSR